MVNCKSPYEPREDSTSLEAYVRQYAKGSVLDMGTGSGIQAITAAHNSNVSSVLATDVQEDTGKLLPLKISVLPPAVCPNPYRRVSASAVKPEAYKFRNILAFESVTVVYALLGFRDSLLSNISKCKESANLSLAFSLVSLVIPPPNVFIFVSNIFPIIFLLSLFVSFRLLL